VIRRDDDIPNSAITTKTLIQTQKTTGGRAPKRLLCLHARDKRATLGGSLIPTGGLTIMKTQRLVIALTATEPCDPDVHPASRQTVAVCGGRVVLRGRALEIVDDQGHVRAMIKIFPADPTVKMPDGTTGYPETVLLRLIDSKGAPNVKIAGDGGRLGRKLRGRVNPTHVQVLARGKQHFSQAR